MSNLIPMDEAARILGMTPEQVSELRSNNEIFGYKDGSTWKFKMTELERVADELGITLNTSEAAKVADDISESFGFELSDPDLTLDSSDDIQPIEDLDSSDYAEDSSVELLNPADPTLSVGDDDKLNLDDDGELQLADSGILAKGDSGTSKELGDLPPSDESILDDDDDELSFGSSSLSLASESSRKLADASDSGDSMAIASETGDLVGKDAQEDDFSMPDDDFTFADDSGSFEDSAELSSDFEDSDQLILDDSDSSTEITLESNESGINLQSSASGISLEDSAPLDLGQSDIDDLELPGDDDDMIVLEESAAPDATTQMLQEDDFDLTPLETANDDDSSGSQVIALEDSEIYADESDATILGESGDFEAQPAMLDDQGFGQSDFGGGYDMGQPGYDPAMAHAGPAALPEAPYSLLQVLSLGGVALLLLLGGMIAYNLAQNLWMPSDQVIESSVLTTVLKLFGG